VTWGRVWRGPALRGTGPTVFALFLFVFLQLEGRRVEKVLAKWCRWPIRVRSGDPPVVAYHYGKSSSGIAAIVIATCLIFTKIIILQGHSQGQGLQLLFILFYHFCKRDGRSDRDWIEGGTAAL
jgi:hypothetical protein